jgi:hypothetical protein
LLTVRQCHTRPDTPSLKAAATAQPMQETTAGGGRGRLLPGPAERTEDLVNARDVDTGPVVLDFDTTDVVKSTLLEQPYANVRRIGVQSIPNQFLDANTWRAARQAR